MRLCDASPGGRVEIHILPVLQSADKVQVSVRRTTGTKGFISFPHQRLAHSYINSWIQFLNDKRI